MSDLLLALRSAVSNPQAALRDVIPAKARKYVYASIALASVIYAAYEAANGDWRQAGLSLIPTVMGWLAHNNTNTDAPAD